MDRRTGIALAVFVLVPVAILARPWLPNGESAPLTLPQNARLIAWGLLGLLCVLFLAFAAGRWSARTGAPGLEPDSKGRRRRSEKQLMLVRGVRSSDQWVVHAGFESGSGIRYLDLKSDRSLTIPTASNWQEGQLVLAGIPWRWTPPHDHEKIAPDARLEIFGRIRKALLFLEYRNVVWSGLQDSAQEPVVSPERQDSAGSPLAPRMFRPLAMQSENGWAVCRDFQNPALFLYHDLAEGRVLELPLDSHFNTQVGPTHSLRAAAWRWRPPHAVEEIGMPERKMILFRTREACNALGMQVNFSELEKSAGISAEDVGRFSNP
ncbi:MAG: hypothetical protein NTW19_23725 [Planctomycetota bacterium]|nr:hypothetical protein [Planctomycetota bacterium]